MRDSTVASAVAVALAIGALVTMAPSVRAQSASEKVEKKIEQVEDKAKSAGEKAKTEVSDSWLTAKTKIGSSPTIG